MNILIEQDIEYLDIFNILKNKHVCTLWDSSQISIYNALYKFKTDLYIGSREITWDGFKIIITVGKEHHIKYKNLNYVYPAILHNTIKAEKNECYSAELAVYDEQPDDMLIQVAADFKTLIFGKSPWLCGQYCGDLGGREVYSLYSSAKIMFSNNLQRAVDISQYTLCISSNLEFEKYGIETVCSHEELNAKCQTLIQNEDLRQKMIDKTQQQLKICIPTYENILNVINKEIKIL
jgi:hypothetical protein